MLQTPLCKQRRFYYPFLEIARKNRLFQLKSTCFFQKIVIAPTGNP